ncbi:lipoprotein-releasing ABC transporter ATP-binding protein LolD [Marinobacteraceae bacterium S3BR75-40.1]
MSNEQPLIHCRSVRKSYREGHTELTVFEDISLELSAGETLAIVGSSGAGKTTLLNILGGLDKPSSGSVEILGEEIHKMREKARCRFRSRALGFVYQFHHLLPEFNALENVAMPCLLAGESIQAAREKARTLLDQVGLGDRLEHKPGELSGGERQRVAIARALVNRPNCVLMDEPTGNLDESTADQVQQLIENLTHEYKTAFVVVTHDRRLAGRMGRILRLDHGRLKEDDGPLNVS